MFLCVCVLPYLAVAEVQFQVIIFLRGIYSRDLYCLLAKSFVVVYSGGLLPTLHSCQSLLFGRLVWIKQTAKFLHVSARVRCFEW
jgi:hypothetical protein